MSDDTHVATANGEFEAQQIRAFLESHDIPSQFQGEALRKTHGLTLDGLGLVEVHVPLDHVERARALLAQVEAGQLELDESSELLE
jgi:hypothetical protein